MSYRRLVYLTVFLLISSSQFSSCSCSESSGGSSGLSKYSAFPGEILSINDASIVDDSVVSISFKGENNYVIDIQVADTDTGVARFAVPVFIDTTAVSFDDGAFSSAEVIVSLNGKDIATPLLINPLPSLSGINPGFIYKQFLQVSIDEYNLAIVQFNQMATNGYDVSAEIAAINNQLDYLNALVSQIDLLMAGTISSISMGNETLTAADIQVMEEVMAAYVGGVADYLQTTATSSKTLGKSQVLVRSITEQDCYNAVNGDTSSPAYDQCVKIVRQIEYVISETKRGVKGAAALLAGVTVGVAVWAKVSAGWAAAEVGKAAGISLAYLRATFDTFSSSVTNKLSDAFNNDNRPSFDDGKRLIKNAVDVGAQWISTVPGQIGEFFNWISTGSTLLDGAKDLDATRCAPPPSSNKYYPVILAAVVDEFCDDYDPTIIDQVSFLLAEVVFDNLNYAHASIGFMATQVFYEGSVTYTDSYLNEITRTGYPTVYAEASNGLHFMLIMNQDLINGPGDYPVTTDDVVPGENGYVTLFLDTPDIIEEDSNGPVGFMQVTGTLSLDEYGENIGDRIKGTFDIDMAGSRTICLDISCENDYQENITGNVNGLFDGFLQDPSTLF